MFDSFVTIHCSMYCDIIILILSCLYTFLMLYLYILSHCNICFDIAYILCNRFFDPHMDLMNV